MQGKSLVESEGAMPNEPNLTLPNVVAFILALAVAGVVGKLLKNMWHMPLLPRAAICAAVAVSIGMFVLRLFKWRAQSRNH
jgi:hypothetical protein